MKSLHVTLIAIAFGLVTSCNSANEQDTAVAATESNTDHAAMDHGAGQSAVADDQSQQNVVQVAAGSKDHTTLVAAVKAAGLVDALTNAGPFTVFAPTNAAFDKLPAGTVDGLMKPESRKDLRNILQYHVYVGVIPAERFDNDMSLGQVNGGRVNLGLEGDQPTVNGVKILASIPTSNGIIHVIDQVLLPQ
ncbi:MULTISPECIES: fasciclin domain-containing protein [Pontibacter]|uniref:Uncaracterized surface protein containing fasciclin (FAS1) repeats n=1 Tax=Pontibacter lucknowensis TaxID=1077936 RepID=A0A1N6XDD7_9BACT|nr:MULTISPECIES: fasciclin domain-containing protein [Pontibacter]EJF08378.1 fasciclin domain-containing protein [Pontibacter sp. BAB1700]SIR00362.1 Uncaracterized surface protein containing fasciclin (FAS1) repeats [Pontibacter lucknowensis]